MYLQRVLDSHQLLFRHSYFQRLSALTKRIKSPYILRCPSRILYRQGAIHSDIGKAQVHLKRHASFKKKRESEKSRHKGILSSAAENWDLGIKSALYRIRDKCLSIHLELFELFLEKWNKEQLQ